MERRSREIFLERSKTGEDCSLARTGKRDPFTPSDPCHLEPWGGDDTDVERRLERAARLIFGILEMPGQRARNSDTRKPTECGSDESVFRVVVGEQVKGEYETAGECAEPVADPHVLLRLPRRSRSDADRGGANEADV